MNTRLLNQIAIRIRRTVVRRTPIILIRKIPIFAELTADDYERRDIFERYEKKAMTRQPETGEAISHNMGQQLHQRISQALQPYRRTRKPKPDDDPEWQLPATTEPEPLADRLVAIGQKLSRHR